MCMYIHIAIGVMVENSINRINKCIARYAIAIHILSVNIKGFIVLTKWVIFFEFPLHS